MVFSQIEIGTIPTSVDEVMIGSAATLRPAQVKYVFLLGLCEGEFPASVNERGLFSSADRKTLSSVGIELSLDSTTDARASDELMFVQRAFATPSCGLYLFTSVAEQNGQSRTPSLPFRRTRALFENLKEHRYFANDLRYLTGAPKNAAAQLRNLEKGEEAQALKQALADHLSSVNELSSAELTDPVCRVAQDHLPLRKNDSLHFSATRFETYVKCPFNYYCTYELGLREKKQANFRTSMMGSFIHYILEHLIRFATTPTADGTLPSDELLLQKAEVVVEEYIDKITPPNEKDSQRLRHLYRRLKRLAVLMMKSIVDEFSKSDFVPAFFELPFNGKNGNPSPMEFTLQDGIRVTFSGIVDRVDLLRKDGDTYVRIVDYKTGSKTFSLEDVTHGINLQMLLYLFALCRTQSKEFAQTLGLSENQSPIPAGIVYLSANIPVVEAEEYDAEESILKKATDSFKRSGLLLNDEDVLLAMNHDLSPKFLAGIKRNKDGELVGKSLSSKEEFDDLYRQIETTVETIASELRSGIADAIPTDCPGQDPCSYCQMKPICRNSNS